MLKRLGLFLLISLVIQSCSSSKTKVSSNSKGNLPVKKEVSVSEPTQSVLKSALRYKGTRYKYGGTTKRGMDCSGLIYVAFTDNDISVPRSTDQLRSYGEWVDLKQVTTGDLVFFATRKNSRKVNHVGLVTEVMDGDLRFIHASTSKGVIESNLSERYWYFAFVQARRIF
jgi:cell wall-associated NlpC family hydrolase